MGSKERCVEYFRAGLGREKLRKQTLLSPWLTKSKSKDRSSGLGGSLGALAAGESVKVTGMKSRAPLLNGTCKIRKAKVL